MQLLTIHVLPDIQHRGCHIVRNIMIADEEMCARIVNTNIIDIFIAIVQINEPDRAKVSECYLITQ